MNETIINKWAMGLAVFSFGFLSIGSFLFGATVTTSILRALGGAVFFGALLWLVGLLINEEEDSIDDDIEGEDVIDQEPVAVNSEAVREKFLKKSSEIAEKNLEEKKANETEEATPF
ncbi:MAG: hypothetical protein HOB32_07355 [Nitrospina sp.]|jgi:hypothetical protein|nr:hypothetical protein [Nitrospina sp.]MBT6601457.1 hypothetical protein [Nitrospina sp.]